MPKHSRSQPEPADDAPALTPYEQFLRDTGARIRALRHAQGLSMPLMAEFSGVTSASLSRIEQGKKNFRLKTADHLARAIGVHTHELFIPPELSDLPAEPRRRQRRAHAPADVEEQEQVFREFLAHIGSRVRELRKIQQLPLSAVSHFMGLSPQALEAIERGETNISVKTADRIAEAIGVHTHELFIPRARSELHYTGEPESAAVAATPTKSATKASRTKTTTTKGTGRARRRS